MLWQQRQNLGQWRIRPLPQIPKSTERNGRIPPKDILSHKGIPILLLSDNYFYLDARYTNLHHKGHPHVPPSAKNCDLLKFQTSKLVFSSNNQSWVYRNPKFQVYWAQWTKAMNHFPFKLSRTIWMHVRYWKEKTRFGSSDAFYRGSTLT